jgi:hypothetical protein
MSFKKHGDLPLGDPSPGRCCPGIRKISLNIPKFFGSTIKKPPPTLPGVA